MTMQKQIFNEIDAILVAKMSFPVADVVR